METRKVLSSLCYFSIFFAGFIFPLAVFIASGDESTKMHAKKSLLSHLIPLILTPLLLFAVFYDFTNIQDTVPTFTIISIAVLVVVWLIVVIWNIVKGVKVLLAE
ncbi:DUF4870 domain-containing protein [Neobacillus sp. MM2021_6]|uniref:DUF4870 domain-containing protein n=1 Tax=Bacillaceae TaxID=186817 RepID=UPI00140E8272|nr:MULTISPECIES: DUF4870 domain-containing protein [Bacillaceae]MBO0959046.1 DUF4870 domain-containing protein [Neobacillus sp. MM2021_6]NHC17776.1 DUF4870 domain-containing protein [Bacillus sp. MM2020_4]